jgi:hypothetical protein
MRDAYTAGCSIGSNRASYRGFKKELRGINTEGKSVFSQPDIDIQPVYYPADFLWDRPESVTEYQSYLHPG